MNCVVCKGNMKPNITNYVVNLENCVIVVRNVPCMECTQCGETSFDDAVMKRLEEIVTPLRSAMAEVTVVNYPAA